MRQELKAPGRSGAEEHHTFCSFGFEVDLIMSTARDLVVVRKMPLYCCESRGEIRACFGRKSTEYKVVRVMLNGRRGVPTAESVVPTLSPNPGPWCAKALPLTLLASHDVVSPHYPIVLYLPHFNLPFYIRSNAQCPFGLATGCLTDSPFHGNPQPWRTFSLSDTRMLRATHFD